MQFNDQQTRDQRRGREMRGVTTLGQRPADETESASTIWSVADIGQKCCRRILKPQYTEIEFFNRRWQSLWKYIWNI